MPEVNFHITVATHASHVFLLMGISQHVYWRKSAVTPRNWRLSIQQQQLFTALCPGLPGWAGTRRNTHPLTIL